MRIAATPRGAAVTLALAIAAYSSPVFRKGGGLKGSTPPPRTKSNRPFFEETEQRLKAVRPSKAGVPTREFIHASYALIRIFDSLSGMSMVKSDMVGNCDKIWKHMTMPDEQTLEAMCDAEIAAFGGNVDKAWRVDGSVCNSLLWLKRAVSQPISIRRPFDCRLALLPCPFPLPVTNPDAAGSTPTSPQLRLVEGIMKALLKKPAKTMKECCNAAYAASLKRHHNFVMKSAFSVAVNAAPSRDEFLGKLAPGAGAEAALKTLARLQPMFTKQLDAVESYLVARKIEK